MAALSFGAESAPMPARPTKLPAAQRKRFFSRETATETCGFRSRKGSDRREL